MTFFVTGFGNMMTALDRVGLSFMEQSPWLMVHSVVMSMWHSDHVAAADALL